MVLRDSTFVNAPPEAIFQFFEQMDGHYCEWHPDHVLFRWVTGRGVHEGHVFYFEEYIAGKLLKKRVRFTRIEPHQLMEFAPTCWLMKLFLPRMLFRIQPEGDGCHVIAEIHLRMGPLARRLQAKELDAVREHMRVEAINMRRLVEQHGRDRRPGS